MGLITATIRLLLNISNFKMWASWAHTFPIYITLYNRRSDYPLNGMAVSANFKFRFSEKDSVLKKLSMDLISW